MSVRSRSRVLSRALPVFCLGITSAALLVGCQGDESGPAKPELTGVFNSATQEANSIGIRKYIGSTDRPRIKGDAEEGTTVRIYPNSKCEGTLSWNRSADELAGTGIEVSVSARSETTFSARAEDESGAESECSTVTVTYLHDPDRPMVPQPPQMLAMSPGSPSNDETPSVVGRTEPHARVEVYRNSPDCTGGFLNDAGADEQGDFSVPIEVPRNTLSRLYVRVYDLADNGSLCGPAEGLEYEHDSELTLTFIGTIPGGTANNDPTPQVLGQTDPGSEVKLYDSTQCDGVVIGQGTADQDGLFSIEAQVRTPAPGQQGVVTTVIRASALDPAGNPIACSESSLSYVYDNLPPPAALITSTSTSPSNDETPTVGGTIAEAGVWVQALVAPEGATGPCPGTPSGAEVQVGEGGAFTLNPTVPENTVSRISVRARDAAGNTSCSSNSVFYTEDSSSSPVAFTGFSVPQPTYWASFWVLGMAEEGSTVELYVSPACDASLKIGEGAAADFAGAGIEVTLPFSHHNQVVQIHAAVTDTLGNRTCHPNSIAFDHDSTSPGQPLLYSISPANNNTPTVRGYQTTDAHPGTVTIYASDNCTGTVKGTGPVAADGTFAVTVIPVLDNTATRFSAKHVDAAGVPSSCSFVSVVYREDSFPPNAPLFSGLSPAGSGYVEPVANVLQTTPSSWLGEVFQVRIVRGTSCSTSESMVVGSTGEWDPSPESYTIQTDLPGWNLYTLRAITVDNAGNFSACSAPRTYDYYPVNGFTQ